MKPVGWWADAPEKAWAERFFLAQSPLWISAAAVVILTGWIHQWRDVGYLLFGLLTMAPAVFGPLAFGQRPDREMPIHSTYWFKFNVWIFILVAFGTYFGTHYFFDLMGMRYAFAVRWTFEAEVVGHSEQTVPLFMYPLTHAYFVTYHAGLVVLLRRLKRTFALGRVGTALVVLLLAYAMAWLETFVMANERLSAYFAYADRERMLWLGSVGYALYFVVSVPMVMRIDEHGPRWPLSRVVVEALATCMIVLVLLELWAKVVGPL